MSPGTVQALDYFMAESPLSRPLADATHRIPALRFLVARVTLADGTVGEGYLLAFHFSPGALRGALDDARALSVGRVVPEMGAFNAACDAAGEYFGPGGLQRWARGIVNLALWDAWGRQLGRPIWQVLGTHARRIPVYGSGGWLSYDDAELVAEVGGYVRRGFRAVKIKVGAPEGIARDVERLKLVREAIGPHVRLMMDANQGLAYPAALELARRARPLGIHWFEEPLPHDDYDGYAALRTNAGIALAMGEREYDTVPLRELIRRNALDLWQPDILRLGGVEGWLGSAALARAHHLPVLPHFYKEYDVALSCTVPGVLGVESFDWVDGLVDRPVRMADGHAEPSPGPGWGFRFKDDVLRPLDADPP